MGEPTRGQQMADAALKRLQDLNWVNGRGEITMAGTRVLLEAASKSSPVSIHPNTMAFLEKSIAEALSELDKLGQPHRVGCNLAVAWGMLKGQLQARTTPVQAAPVEGIVVPTELARQYRRVWYEPRQSAVKMEREELERRLAILFSDALSATPQGEPTCKHEYPHVVMINGHWRADCTCGWSAEWPAVSSEEVRS